MALGMVVGGWWLVDSKGRNADGTRFASLSWECVIHDLGVRMSSYGEVRRVVWRVLLVSWVASKPSEV